MSLWEILLLGFVQGVAEFLPISSSGHLVILEALLGRKMDNVNLNLNIALHFGTLLSILVVYRRDIIPTLKQFRLVAAVVIATLPLVVPALFFKDLFEQASASPLLAGYGFLVTAVLLVITPRIDHGTRELPAIRYRDALVVGLFQAIAPWPGVSRSGSTIVGGLLVGMRREGAANFSFYIAVPAILGATVFMVKDLMEATSTGGPPLAHILAGTAVSFVVGVVSLKALLKLVVARKLVWFAAYVFVLGVGTIVASLMGKI